MNRREFTKSLAAAAAAPVLPTKALSVGATVVPEALFAKAANWARVWHMSTPDTFRKILDVDEGTANVVFDRLQDEGVISATDASGFAHAVNPWFRDPKVAVNLSQKLMTAPAMTAKTKLKAAIGEPAGAKASGPVEHRDALKREVLDLAEEEAPQEDNARPEEGEVLAE